MTSVKNKFARWFSVYFPEYAELYDDLEVKSGTAILKAAPMPEDIVKLGVAGIIQSWENARLKGFNRKSRAENFVNAAKKSIGMKNNKKAAILELKILIEDFENKIKQLDTIIEMIQELMKQIKGVEKLLAIKGIAEKTVSGFLAEVGDLRRFKDAKQVQKYAGLSIVENSSGKHKGKSKISKRGRKRLRTTLFLASQPLIAYNPAFREIHHYYMTRNKNPLKKMQLLIAIKL